MTQESSRHRIYYKSEPLYHHEQKLHLSTDILTTSIDRHLQTHHKNKMQTRISDRRE